MNRSAANLPANSAGTAVFAVKRQPLAMSESIIRVPAETQELAFQYNDYTSRYRTRAAPQLDICRSPG
jgi:hypothetical protein